MILPDHRHVPGRTARHPEGAFDWIRDQAPARTLSGAPNPAWDHGLALIAAGFWWEAHEVLEPVWMNAAPNSPERAMAQGVIQIANAALKQEMAKPRAARRLCALAEGHVREAGAGAPLGLAPAAVLDAIADLRAQIDAGGAPVVTLSME